MAMNEQDKINAETQMKLALQDAKFAIFMNELKEQREDIRRLNDKIDSKFDSLTNQLHNLTIAAIVGFGAIVVAIGGVFISAFK